MINYFKQNHLSLLIVAFLVLQVLVGGGDDELGVLDTTTITNPHTFEQAVTLESGATLQSTLGVTGATTLSSSLTVSGETTVEGFTEGAGVNATTTSAASETLLEADLLADNVFEVSGENDAMTLVLPATSTMTTLLPNAGDMREWFFEFATTTTATLTISAGTGIDLVAVTANDDVIDEGEFSRLTCYRQTDTDVTCIISELLAAD